MTLVIILTIIYVPLILKIIFDFNTIVLIFITLITYLLVFYKVNGLNFIKKY